MFRLTRRAQVVSWFALVVWPWGETDLISPRGDDKNPLGGAAKILRGEALFVGHLEVSYQVRKFPLPIFAQLMRFGNTLAISLFALR